ncbi:hypothetical protein [Lysinibacillus sp. 3P01SB]
MKGQIRRIESLETVKLEQDLEEKLVEVKEGISKQQHDHLYVAGI